MRRVVLALLLALPLLDCGSRPVLTGDGGLDAGADAGGADGSTADAGTNDGGPSDASVGDGGAPAGSRTPIGRLMGVNAFIDDPLNLLIPLLAAGFTGDAFAAMASADYDGDQGRLGNNIGVKNADPNAKLVMGGLSGRYPAWVGSITTYLDAMRTWSAAHRRGS